MRFVGIPRLHLTFINVLMMDVFPPPVDPTIIVQLYVDVV